MDPRDSTDLGSQASLPIIHAYIALQLIGGVGFAIILFTALLSRGVKRSPTWISFCASWVYSCFSYTLLSFFGQQTGKNLDHALCVIQAALIYADPALTSFTTLALVIHMWFTVRFLLAKEPLVTGFITTIVLLAAPYLIWLVIFVGVLVFGLQYPDTVRMNLNGTYCDLNSSMPSKIASLCVIVATGFIVLIEVIIGLSLYRNRSVITGSGNAIRMVLRVMLFSLLGAVGLGVGIAFIVTWEHGPAFDLIMAALPVSGVIIFGSQMDLISVWMFWKPRRVESRPPSPGLDSFKEKFMLKV